MTKAEILKAIIKLKRNNKYQSLDNYQIYRQALNDLMEELGIVPNTSLMNKIERMFHAQG